MLDFLIIGQGIAGSVLALQLLKSGQRIVVINNRQTNQASSAAAGIYNPITGKNMVKTWLADVLFPYLISFYKAAEQTLSAQFLHEKPMFRPFLTAQERTVWLTRALAVDYNTFVEAVVDTDYHQKNMVVHHGGLLLKQTGYLDVSCFLEATRAYLEVQGAYLEADFVHDQVRLHSDVHYQHLKAHKLIFCEGPQAQQNPFFKGLSLRPVKGERLSVALQQPLEVIYNRSVFVLPQVANEAIVGATYDWRDLSLAPTARARQSLEKKLRSRFQLSYTVLGQKAGIRPATFDRKPFIGLHPEHPQVGIFNGLGTKGVSLAPYWAQVFVEHLLWQRELPWEVQLNRIRLAP